MPPADQSCANDPEPFGNCPVRDRSRKSPAAAAWPGIPAACRQTARSEHQTNWRMSEDLRLRSRWASSWRAGRAGGHWVPALKIQHSVKITSPGRVTVVDHSIFCHFIRRKGLCMRPVLDRGVPQEERHKVALGSLTDWDAARVFLEVVRCGSFRSAAERLELSINFVRRRIDDFERQVGATLFTRDVHGTRLTDEGSLVVSAVERMEAASFDLLRASNSAASALSGEVRVAITEGLGTYWLAPRLVEFQQSFPNILVDLQCVTRSADVSRHEADIAIHLAQPPASEIKVVRLGRLHLMFFASQKYL